jgi:hypothetical protein
MKLYRVIVNPIFPPIPTNRFDFCCYIDGEEEFACQAFGNTPNEAVAEFLDWFELGNFPEREDELLRAMTGKRLSCPIEDAKFVSRGNL